METALSTPELLTHIFTFLDFTTIKMCRRVSRFWKQQTEYCKFWENVQLKLDECKKVDQVSDDLLNIISNIVILNRDNYRRGHGKLPWLFNEMFLISSPKTNLQEVPSFHDYHAISDFSKKLLSIIPHLKILEMEYCQLNSYQLTSVYQHITNLQLLILDDDLRDVPADLLALTLTKVKRVNLEYANLCTKQLTLIYQEISSSSNSILENIKIAFSDHTNVETELLISAFSKLKQVELDTCKINFEQIVSILKDRRIDSLDYLSLFTYPWNIKQIPLDVRCRKRDGLEKKIHWCYYCIVVASLDINPHVYRRV